MSDTRYKYIDIGAGIMILWMIIYHALGAGLGLEESRRTVMCCSESCEVINLMQEFPFLLFFMPWFFYKSGMFFRLRSAKELLVYDSRKYLKPFVIWSSVGYVFYAIICLIDGRATLHALTYSVVRNAVLNGHVPINMALWFLLSLVAVRQLCNIFFRKVHPLAIAFAGLAIAYFCHLTELRLMPLWVANIGSGTFFFSFGYWLHHNVRIPERLKSLMFVISLTVFVLWCIISYLLSEGSIVKIPIVDMGSNVLVQGHYLLWYPICLSGIAAFNQMMKKCESLSSPLLFWVARNAEPIYVIHFIPNNILLWIATTFYPSMNSGILLGLILTSYGILFAAIRIFNA